MEDDSVCPQGGGNNAETMEMRAMIRLIDVHKEYDNGTKALRGINLRIEDGEYLPWSWCLFTAVKT